MSLIVKQLHRNLYTNLSIRNYFNTVDLVGHFEQLKNANNLPTFESLMHGARCLARRHAGTDSFQRAHFPSLVAGHVDEVPLGSPWSASGDTGGSADECLSESDSLETISVLSQSMADGERDAALANATLFIRNSLWWREVCHAIQEGDPGRVWEVLKVSISWVFLTGECNSL